MESTISLTSLFSICSKIDILEKFINANDLESVKIIISSITDWKLYLNDNIYHIEKLLTFLLNKNENELIKSILSQIPQENKNEMFLRTPEINNIKIFNLLLEDGVDINCRIKSGYSFLCRAAQYYFTEDVLKMMTLIIEKGGDVNAHVLTDPAWTPLTLLCDSKHVDIKRLTLLLDHGANINYLTPCGNTPFYFLCRNSKNYGDITEIIKFMLEKGADPKTKNSFGESPADVINAKYEKLLKAKIPAKTLYYGIKCHNQKTDLKLPNLLEIKNEDNYYYVYKLTNTGKDSFSAPDSQHDTLKLLGTAELFWL